MLANDRAAVEAILDGMPKFTEPTTLDDITAYHTILKQRLAAQGVPWLCEVKRHHAAEPVEIVVGPIVRRLMPVKL